MKISKLLAALVLPMAFLVGCGGGSSTAVVTPVTPVTPVVPPVPPVPPTPPALVKPITVVPALGAFGAGANVAFIRPDGSAIGSAQTGTNGAAIVDMGIYVGPFISKVTGGPGVTFYNEKTLGRDPFGATDTLMAIVPSVPTGASPSLGVTPLTNAAASVLIADPANPKIVGTDAATIRSQISVANATVAVAAGLPAGVDMLSAPQALSSPTDKISNISPAAVAYGAYLAALAQAVPTGTTLLANMKAIAADAKANNGALPATAATFTTAATNLAAVVLANVATTSQSASLTALTVAIKPDPALSRPESKAAITAVATTNNGGTAPTTPVVVPPVVVPPVVVPPVVVPPVVVPPVVVPPVVVPPVVVPPAPIVTAPTNNNDNTNTCTNPTIGSSTNGTFTLYINGVAYTGNIVSGILYAANGGLNATGSGSGVVSGTVSGSSGGNDGYLLTTPLNLVTGSASGTALIDTKTYNINVTTSETLTLTCP
jgi:hypothetical protein